MGYSDGKIPNVGSRYRFQVAPSIQEVVHDRCDYNLYGYTLTKSFLYMDQKWWLQRHRASVLKRTACSM